MNEKISWDHSLVKKYSSSNHYKLLNQLRNEVKKYPLIKKKNTITNIRNKSVEKDKLIASSVQDISLSKNQESNKDTKTLSTVSFNNSKNFSIYNSNNNETTKIEPESRLVDLKNSNVDSSSSTFKDRLDQIDLK